MRLTRTRPRPDCPEPSGREADLGASKCEVTAIEVFCREQLRSGPA